MFGDTSRWGDWSKNPALTESQKEIFCSNGSDWLQEIGKIWKEDGPGTDDHSDLNINNILVDGDQVKIWILTIVDMAGFYLTYPQQFWNTTPTFLR